MFQNKYAYERNVVLLITEKDQTKLIPDTYISWTYETRSQASQFNIFFLILFYSH